MFHYFGLKINRDFEVEHPNRFSPFASEAAAHSFFFEILPQLLKGTLYLFDTHSIDDLIDNIYEVPDIRLVMFSTHNNRRLLYRRDQLIEMLFKNLNIPFVSYSMSYKAQFNFKK